MNHPKRLGVCVIGLLFVVTSARGDVIQMDVKGVFNANVIVACRDGKIIAAEQVDNGGYSFVTQSAAAMFQKDEPAGLPDDGHFAADARHPEIQLAYRNGQEGNNVRRSAPGNDKFSFAVPEREYTRIQLFVTAGNGGAPIKLTFTYADGSREQRESEAPDWFAGVTQTDDDRFILIGNLDRIHRASRGGYEHIQSVMVYGINFYPDKNKAVTHITVEKTSENSSLCFFGAIGQTPEPTTQPGK